MNSSRTFWLIFGLLTAVAVHLAYILFVPPGQLNDRIAALIGEAGTNRLVVAEDGSAAAALASHRGELAYAICAFDLSRGPLEIKARVPDQYWSIEVYGPRGNTIYTLNDIQAPRRQLSIFLHDENPDPQAIVEAAKSNNRGLNAITVLTGTTTGIAVLRSAGAGALERRRALDAFNASSCGPA
jgi:uncharacterized membrane protein